MKVLLNFTYGISLEKWYNSGLLFREISLYKELSKKNVDIGFLTYGDYNDLNYAEYLDDIKIFPINKYVKSNIFLIKLIKSALIPFKLKKLFTSYEIIKTVQVYGSWVACIAKLLYKKKVIIKSGFEWLSTWKNIAKRNSLKEYLKYLSLYIIIFFNELIAYKLADGIILTSDYDIPFVIRNFKLKKKFKNKKIRLIYNFIDENQFRPISTNKKEKHILWIGRFVLGKNIFNFLKAFKELKGYTLDIIGKGPYEKRMKKLINDLDINVNFLGLFPNSQIPEIMNQYHVFILPSVSEGNPKVLLEAMSCGIACIGTNIPGINNIIQHKENGFLCGTNPESIRKAISTVYENKELREKIAKNARKFVLENCSLKTITEKEYLFYQDILNEKKN